jgi:K+-transporting ATPase KdpF subunit
MGVFRRDSRFLCRLDWVYGAARALAEGVMSVFIWVGLALGVGLFVYLLVFLLNPERFL